MQIRPVTFENAAHCVELGRELVALGTFGADGPEFDWDFTMKSTQHVLVRPDYYLRIAFDDNGEHCGFVAGHMDTFFFSPKQFAVEDSWFVRDGTKDRTKIAVALMRGFVSWALDERKALLVQSGDIASIDTLAVDSIYKHMGFTRFGTVYKYARDK